LNIENLETILQTQHLVFMGQVSPEEDSGASAETSGALVVEAFEAAAAKALEATVAEAPEATATEASEATAAGSWGHFCRGSWGHWDSSWPAHGGYPRSSSDSQVDGAEEEERPRTWIYWGVWETVSLVVFLANILSAVIYVDQNHRAAAI
jgi:hypothetical protein